MNKDFNVKSFVEEYEKCLNNDDKAKFLKSKLKTEKYIPYADKLTLADNIKNIMPDFDALNFNSLIEVIFEKIGDKETAEFNTVVEMVLNDFMANKYQFKNYIDDTLLKVSGLVEKCAPLIDNITSKLDSMSDEDVDKLSGLLGKVTKFIK